MEFVLRPLLRKWRSQGRGWALDSFWLPAICYADDVLLVSTSKSDLQSMAEELIGAFGSVGLDVSLTKCHWTSYPPDPGSSLRLCGQSLSWESQMNFVGTVLDLSGNDGVALENRIAQAEKTYHKWGPYFRCTHVSVRLRLALLASTVFSSAFWLAETWQLTRQQREHLDSWGARVSARVRGVRHSSAEDIGQFWRRLHRTGHKMLSLTGGGLGGPDSRRASRLHAFAGHVAWSVHDIVNRALHTRCLSW